MAEKPSLQSQTSPRWTEWHDLSLVFMIAVIGLVGLLAAPVFPVASWLLILLLLTAFTVVTGHGVTGLWHGLLVDGRNRLSLSRLQTILWTLLVLSGFLTAALFNIALRQPDLWLLMGISLTSLVGSPLIIQSKKSKAANGEEVAWTLEALERQAKPNQKWVADISYIPTDQGWLYLATVMDLFSRKIVGWSMNPRMKTDLVSAGLQMAWLNRCPQAGLRHPSDQGSQYASHDYQKLLGDYGIQVSMSRAGNCYDNAVLESFFATLKTECVDRRYATRDEARACLFDYIEVWHNLRRRHSSLGYLSPEAFERQRGCDKITVH